MMDTDTAKPASKAQCRLCWKHEGHFDWCVARVDTNHPAEETSASRKSHGSTKLTRRTAILIRRLLESDHMRPVFEADPEFRDTLMIVRDRLFSIHNRNNQIGGRRG